MVHRGGAASSRISVSWERLPPARARVHLQDTDSYTSSEPEIEFFAAFHGRSFAGDGDAGAG